MRIIAFLPAVAIAIIMAALTGMWQFAIFAVLSAVSGFATSLALNRKRKDPDLDFSDQPIWLSPAAVAIGDKVLPRTGLFFREYMSDHLFNYFSLQSSSREIAAKASSLAETYYRAKLQGKLTFWAGMAENSDLEFDLVSQGPHALIVGTTGSGKSEFLKLISCSILAGVSEKDVRLVLIDFKGGAALRKLEQHPSTLKLVTDLDSTGQERFWLYLQGELRVRELELSEQGVGSIEEAKNIPRLLVLADELPAILSSSALAMQTFEAIAARGRSLGVHLIATSQSLSGIPRSLITNLPLRFALGVTDPGDLISLSPNFRPSEVSISRAVAICGGKVVGFDFPMTEKLPGLGKAKVDLAAVEEWTVGLPNTVEFQPGAVGLVEEPLSHQRFYVTWEEFKGKSILIVGSSGSGKSSFCDLARTNYQVVLDCPELADLELALVSGEQLVCAIKSTQVLPLAIQRRFEIVIYLNQGNLDQHLTAGLPRSQWQDSIPPGRCWYKGKPMQLVMPRPNQAMNSPASVQQRLVH